MQTTEDQRDQNSDDDCSDISVRFMGSGGMFVPLHSDGFSETPKGRNESLDDVLSMTSDAPAEPDLSQQFALWRVMDRSASPPLVPKGFHTTPRHTSSSPSMLPPPLPHRLTIHPAAFQNLPQAGPSGYLQHEQAVADELLRRRPKRIILVRHGESEGNVDEGVYTRIADSRVPLTPLGFEQAVACGKRIRQMLELDSGERQGEEKEWGVYFYVSPYTRTLQTLRGIGRAFEPRRILGVREEPRLREQDFGNFQVRDRMQAIKLLRERFGKFFFRFPEGESAADVYDRITGFLDSLWRDIEWSRLHPAPSPSAAAAPAASAAPPPPCLLLGGDRPILPLDGAPAGRGSFVDAADAALRGSGGSGGQWGGGAGGGSVGVARGEGGRGGAGSGEGVGAAQGRRPPELNIVMVIHGLTMRVFLMRWFRWTVAQFEALGNPCNCEVRVMELGSGGKYSLAQRHSEYELFSWGLTPAMIAEQQRRSTSSSRSHCESSAAWRHFFDHLGPAAAAAAPAGGTATDSTGSADVAGPAGRAPTPAPSPDNRPLRNHKGGFCSCPALADAEPAESQGGRPAAGGVEGREAAEAAGARGAGGGGGAEEGGGDGAAACSVPATDESTPI